MTVESGTDGIEGLIFALAKTVNHLPPHTWRRVRFAVTAEEYQRIRYYFLATEKKFMGAIRCVPLVMEDTPEQVMLGIELAVDDRFLPLEKIID